MHIPLRLLVLAVLFWGTVAASETPWQKLKVGMSSEEIVSVLGDPLLRVKGRGFETWTYDDGAEVVVYRVLVGWTTPAATSVTGRNEDIWAQHPRGDYFTTLRATVRRHVKIPPTHRAVVVAPEPRRATVGLGYEEYLKTLYQVRP